MSKRLKSEKLGFYNLPLKNELDFYSAFKIARFAQKEDYQILHCHSSHALSLGLMAAGFNKDLKVIGARRVDFHIKKNRFSQKKYNSPKLAKIVCISEAIKKVMLEDGVSPEKLTVIRSGIETSRLKNGSPGKIIKEFSLEGKFVAGTIASLEGHKDYPNLLSAIFLVSKRLKNIHFLIVGDGSLKKDLLALAKELEIMDYVTFLGFRADIADIINALDIFVMPSKMEGLGTSVLDAMSVGLPVVSTNAGGITEAVRDGYNGFAVEKENSRALANAIIKVYKDKELREIFSKNALEFVKEFDIEITIEKNIELYGKIMNSK